MSEQTVPADVTKKKAQLFDLRWIIALLFGVYGVVVTILGIGFTTQADLVKAGGVNVNLWSGVPMLVFAVLMALWARLRPVVVEPSVTATEDPSGV